MSDARKQGVSLVWIVNAVSAATGLLPIEIVAHRRNSASVQAREIVCYLARRLTVASYPKIGRALGGRDHTTIMDADERCRARIAAEPEFALLVEVVERTVTALHERLPPIFAERDPIETARRVLRDPWRNGPATPVDSIIAMSALLLDLVEVAEGLRELLDLRKIQKSESRDRDLDAVEDGLAHTLDTTLRALGAQSRHLAQSQETSHAA